MKRKLLISFSGGRTSAYMCWWLLNIWEDRENWETIIVFANTGKEAEETLLFVHKCAEMWNVVIIWVEYVPIQSKIGKWWGVRHNVVNYYTASRNGEPFELMISKLGIPSTNVPFCSKQLKKKPIESYLKSNGWKKYYISIGIRIDEVDRCNEKFRKLRIIYPFISFVQINKKMVNDWWALQSFDLTVDSDFGNCDNCWKKDFKRLVRNAENKPESFEWWQKMTDLYGYLKPRKTKLLPPFNFFRGNLSPRDIFKQVGKNNQIEMFEGSYSRCSKGCEVF